MARLPNIDASKLEIKKNTSPKELLPYNQLVFGRNFTGKSSHICLLYTSDAADEEDSVQVEHTRPLLRSRHKTVATCETW